MKPPSFNAYPNNWLGSGRVSAMLPEQEGAYFRLLCYQWNSENQTIPSSDEDLAMLSRLNGRWATLGAKVRACFDPVDGGGLRNERLWHEYTRIMGLRERQAAGGKKAMGNRWNKQQDSTKQEISHLEDTYNREQRTESRDTGTGNGTGNTIPPPDGSVCPGNVPDKVGRGKRSRVVKTFDAASIPVSLANVRGFAEEWAAWMEARAVKARTRATTRAQELLLKTLAQRPGQAVAAVQRAIKSNWTGFEWAWMERGVGMAPSQSPLSSSTSKPAWQRQDEERLAVGANAGGNLNRLVGEDSSC